LIEDDGDRVLFEFEGFTTCGTNVVSGPLKIFYLARFTRGTERSIKFQGMISHVPRAEKLVPEALRSTVQPTRGAKEELSGYAFSHTG
jgi:hypothetical protein